MAVYTHIGERDLADCLARFGIGSLMSFAGIAEGVDNTNYRVTTGQGVFILTLFEKRVRREDLPFYLSFMEHLRGKGIPCPAIVAGRGGEKIFSLGGKPAIIATFLEGACPRRIETFHAATVGAMTARLHLAAQDFAPRLDNALSLPAWERLIRACGERTEEAEPGLFSLLLEELDYLEKHWPQDIPSGAIHADLFPDNVFFEGRLLTGVIDFYFSCTDAFAYDLMLTFNAWCFENGRFDGQRAAAFLSAYQEKRPLTREERDALNFFGRAAAVRIVATRLYDRLHPVPGALVTPKDPLEYAKILNFHRTERIPA